MGRTSQYAGRVNVIKRIKLGDRWPFAAVVEKNGKLVRDHVWVSGKDEHHPEGRYYIEWYEAGKRRRQAVPILPRSSRPPGANPSKSVHKESESLRAARKSSPSA